MHRLGGAAVPEHPERHRDATENKIITIDDRSLPCDFLPTQKRAVLASQIFDRGLLVRDADDGVTTRDRGVIDPGDRFATAPQNVLAGRQRYLPTSPDQPIRRRRLGSCSVEKPADFSPERVPEPVHGSHKAWIAQD